MGLTLGSIGGSNLGSAGDSTKESSLTSKAFNVLGVVAILRPVDVFKGIKFKTHFAKNLHGNYFILPLIFSCLTLQVVLSTQTPNAKSMMSIAIDTVTRPYANAAATTQETVSQVSSSNLSSINDDGELLVSSCSGRFSKKQLLSLFPLVTDGRMHRKWRTGLDEVQRNNGQTRPWSSRP